MTPQYIKIDQSGNTFYHKDREMTILHRKDGPAVEWKCGDKEWYINGERHRMDGPAIDGFDGSKSWWVNGRRHRMDGPAIEFADGFKYWYIRGKQLTEEEFNRRTSPEIVLTMDEIAAKLGIDVNKLKIKK